MITKKSETQKKLPVLLAAGAMFAPLLNPVSVQAQSYDYRAETNPKIRDAQNGAGVTLRGTVTRDLAGNEFQFRTDDGRTFRVVTRNGEPKWLSNGDRIEVRGWRDGDLFIARDLRDLSNTSGTYPGTNRVTLTGVVTQDTSGNQFLFRTDDGKMFRVQTRTTEPAWISNGDRIEVRGTRGTGNDRDVIVADSVRAISNTGSNQGDRVTLTGVVTQDTSGNQFLFRTDDNNMFRVQTRAAEPAWISNGDRIEVRGTRGTGNDRDVILADNIRPLTNQGGSNGLMGQQITLFGTVTRINTRKQIEVRGDNGQIYTVRTLTELDRGISVNDRVRVVGPSPGNRLVQRAAVTLVTDRSSGNTNTNGNTGSAVAVNFPGRVESVTNNGLIRNLRVRGDNGQVYYVTYRNLQTFRVGDRVRVVGSSRSGNVTATAVTKL